MTTTATELHITRLSTLHRPQANETERTSLDFKEQAQQGGQLGLKSSEV